MPTFKYQEHTPTPYNLFETKQGVEGYEFQHTGFVIRSYETNEDVAKLCSGLPGINKSKNHANGQFIVTACNAHEELVAALTNALWHLRRLGMDEKEPLLRNGDKLLETATTSLGYEAKGGAA